MQHVGAAGLDTLFADGRGGHSASDERVVAPVPRAGVRNEVARFGGRSDSFIEIQEAGIGNEVARLGGRSGALIEIQKAAVARLAR